MQLIVGDSADTSITFNLAGLEMLRLCSNGDIFVKGILTSKEIETVIAFREFVFGSENKSIERYETIIKG